METIYLGKSGAQTQSYQWDSKSKTLEHKAMVLANTPGACSPKHIAKDQGRTQKLFCRMGIQTFEYLIRIYEVPQIYHTLNKYNYYN